MAGHQRLEQQVSARLNLLLMAASDEDQQFSYGFVLHPRREVDGVGFGVITSGGESLPMTWDLLHSVAGTYCWAFGAVPVSLEPDSVAAGDAPVRTVRVRVPEGILEDDELQAYCPVHGLVRADEFQEPLVLLLPARPEGWPC